MTKMTPKQIVALARLKELGVEVADQGAFIDLLIPHGFPEPRCVEFGFLMAQINTHEYPKGFEGMCDVDSKVYEKQKEAPPVHFVDSHPHGMQYRIHLSNPKR